MAPHALGEAVARDPVQPLGVADGVVDRRRPQCPGVRQEAFRIAGGTSPWRPPMVAIQRLPSSGNIRPPRLFWGAWPKVMTPFQSVEASSGMAKMHVA